MEAVEASGITEDSATKIGQSVGGPIARNVHDPAGFRGENVDRQRSPMRSAEACQDSIFSIVALIRGHRFRFASERELQDSIATLLPAHGREVDLGTGPIDFVCNRVGIECKVGGSLSALIRQIHRYAESDLIDSLVVITSRRRHAAAVPAEISGKPVLAVVAEAL